jgi:hypothetical protein
MPVAKGDSQKVVFISFCLEQEWEIAPQSCRKCAFIIKAIQSDKASEIGAASTGIL